MVVLSSFLMGFGGFLEVEWTWRHIAMVGLSCVVGFWDQTTFVGRDLKIFTKRQKGPGFEACKIFA